jgi:NhaP-type Na+/H+ and K+/H+ antiporter
VPAIEPFLLLCGILLLAGVLAGRLSDWLGVPALLLSLAVGSFPAIEEYGCRLD